MTGDIFEMPAGTAAMAFGFHYREDELLDTPGAITLMENAWQADAAGITGGDDTTRAIFAEVDLPLLADKPLVDRLDFNGSVRFTTVESYGADTTYKVGLNWSVNDQLRVRTTYQTTSISARDADPCINWGSKLTDGSISQRTADNCAADGIPIDHIATVGPTILTGGDLNLIAETSEALTFGVIWQPAFAELSLSVDYFDILVEDEIDVIGGTEIVEGCYDSPFFPNEPMCDLFDRSAPTEGLPNSITEIRDSFINVAKQQLRGLDAAAQWATDVGRWGALTVDTQWTYNFEDTVALFDATEEDLAGRAGHPETVGNLNITLDMDKWSIFWGMYYIGETDVLARLRLRTVLKTRWISI